MVRFRRFQRRLFYPIVRLGTRAFCTVVDVVQTEEYVKSSFVDSYAKIIQTSGMFMSAQQLRLFRVNIH